MKRAITNKSHENKKQSDCELHRVPLKTKNENEMKTKNNVQKTILRFAAVVISLVLISYTVSAQDFWKKLIAGSSFNAIALAMVDHSAEATYNYDLSNAAYNFNFVDEEEESLQLEPWMLKDIYANETIIPNVIETEDKLELEPWMLNNSLFEAKSGEQKLKLEDWMTSNAVWK